MNYYPLLSILCILNSINLSGNEFTRFIVASAIKEAFINGISDKRNLEVTFSIAQHQTGSKQSKTIQVSNTEEFVHIAVDLVSATTNPKNTFRDIPVALGRTILREKLLTIISQQIESCQIKEDLMTVPLCKEVGEKATEYPAISAIVKISSKYLFRAFFDIVFDALVKPCSPDENQNAAQPNNPLVA